MKIPRNISSELPRIGPSESPSKYPDEVLPRDIPRSFSTNWWSSEFLRKFVSSEFRRKILRDFRGKMNFRGVISEDLFRRQQCLEQWRQRGFGVGSSSEAGVCGRGNSGVRLVLTATGEGTSLDTSVSCSCGYEMSDRFVARLIMDLG
ncbi:hypothetical protein DY000_02024306 [Brassica cretica]|uniref:Uncharacterized protein n=1 Tax=Brassica cretica TaxID=69181 RepID=A0ABQ7E980_BRACR|nr:hypothetical protein DY000_02024306 [Brassica cretica]